MRWALLALGDLGRLRGISGSRTAFLVNPGCASNVERNPGGRRRGSGHGWVPGGRSHGEGETGRRGDTERISIPSPCLPVSVSSLLPVSVSFCLLARQITEALAAGRQLRLFGYQAKNAILDLEPQAALLTDHGIVLGLKPGLTGVQRAAQHLEQLFVNHQIPFRRGNLVATCWG